jgi:hypothetical protein
LIRLLGRLIPKQLNDEIQLAIAQMKTKGIQFGIALGLAAVALLFLSFMVVALLVSGIMGLGLVVEPWLAALIVAAFFLILAAILGLIGFTRAKKAMPLLPEDAIRGVRYDLGVLREGRSFDPATLDVKKPKEQKKKHDDGEPKPAPVPYHELLRRSRVRREHLAGLRDDLAPRLDVKKQARDKTAKARAFARQGKARAGHAFDTGGATAGATAAPRDNAALKRIMERWQPLAVMGASLVALVAFLRQLGKH